MSESLFFVLVRKYKLTRYEGIHVVGIEINNSYLDKGVVRKSVENKQALGKYGEEYTVRIVQEAGLRIIALNYRCPKGEMDIIASEDETLVFIEVRTRQSSFRGWGEESITPKKVQRLQAIASFYVLQQGYKSWPSMRFDVVAIRYVGERENPEIKWIKAAL